MQIDERGGWSITSEDGVPHVTALRLKKPSGNASSALDLQSGEWSGSYLMRAYLHNSPDPVAYWNDGAHWFMRTSFTVSGTFTGTGEGYNIQPPSADPYMIGVRSDIDGPALQVRAQDAVALPANRIFDGLDFAGNHVFSVRPDGRLSAGVSTYAAQDTFLGRGAPGIWEARQADGSYGSIRGKLMTDNEVVEGSCGATHTLILYDALGRAFKVEGVLL